MRENSSANMFTAADHAHMALAIQLAEKGLNSTSPNPRVGCVIVHNTQIVGTGWHRRAGQPHAEINALRAAKTAANGATVYVTLEPCGHTGRTLPCVKSLVQAKVSKVIIAMQDPNPLVSVREGITFLKQAGIEVQTGLLETEASKLNPGFIHRMHHQRPWVRVKVAASLDGKTALNNGTSQWITSQPARQDGHRWRARSCAILTGIGTVKTDDPQLTVRHINTLRQPLKIVIDNRLEIPIDAKVLHNAGVFIFTASQKKEKIIRLLDLGAQVIELPDRNNRVDLIRMMQKLADLEINELLVEAGSKLNGALIKAGLVNELIIFLAPHLLGDLARGMLSLPELTSLSQRSKLNINDLRMVGQDIRIIAEFR